MNQSCDLSPWPLDAVEHMRLAHQQREQGDAFHALAHEIAAQTLAKRGEADFSARALGDVATGFFMLGRYPAAQRWYELVLALPAERDVAAEAWLNLAAIHREGGRTAEARTCKARAFKIQRVFVETAAAPLRRLLILCEGQGEGNVPLDSLLGTGANTRIKYLIDQADEAEDAGLPPFDLVFNAVGEPDVPFALIQRLQAFAATCSRPMLNAPERVAATQRQNMPTLLRDLQDVVMPPCLRLESAPASEVELAQALATAGISFPVLARPFATHGGLGMQRCETLAELWSACQLQTGQYLSAFHDYRAADGHFRKYRAIFVDRQPLPYHLAISTQWMVHYFSADMPAQAWKLAEELRFLEDPLAALGERAHKALQAIGARLDLDYAGIDFSLLPDGRVLVFEANATMLVHPERQDGPLHHKNPFVTRVVAAFEALLARTVG